MQRAATLGTALTAFLMLAAAQTPPPLSPDQEEIVVTGFRTAEGIRIQGAGLCRKLQGEELDRVNARPRSDKRVQSVIGTDPKGAYEVRSDDHPITGPDYWQRAGTGIDQYVFRATYDGKPICIGAEPKGRMGYGQLRRVLDARALHGKGVRFTALVATRKAHMVRFWLAGGSHQMLVQRGGNTNNFDFRGTHGWTPVTLEIGPIPQHATFLSYGFLLHGGGDVWLQQVKLDVFDMDQKDKPVALATIGNKTKKLQPWN